MLQLFKLFIGRTLTTRNFPPSGSCECALGTNLKSARTWEQIESSNMAATITKQRAEVEGSLYELQRLQEKAERYEM